MICRRHSEKKNWENRKLYNLSKNSTQEEEYIYMGMSCIPQGQLCKGHFFY